MSDDAEIIPPKKNVPASRGRGVATRYEAPAAPTGVISSAVTGWQAEAEARAYGRIANRIRAQREVLDQETERRKSALKLLRVTHELEEAPDILALDRAERKAERAAKYAEIEAKYQKIGYDRDERAHREELTKLRRERELLEARAGIVDANRNLFNAKQGLQNQKRLKQLHLEIWEKRAATEHMDAEKIRMLLSREIDGVQNPKQQAGEGTLDQLAEMRASLAQRAHEAAANGDAVQAEKYERLAAELDDLVVDALRGRTQK